MILALAFFLLNFRCLLLRMVSGIWFRVSSRYFSFKRPNLDFLEEPIWSTQISFDTKTTLYLLGRRTFFIFK